MAGIAGVFGPEADVERAGQMLDQLRHRGSDQAWSDIGQGWCAGVCTAALGEEKGTGHAAQDGLCVLFDGDIYNDRPAGASDVQVVLELYRQHGRLFARYLEGAFAAVVRAGDEVVLARDAVGIRPLYWGRDGEGSLVFASELKALVGVATEVHELHPSTILSSDTGVQGYVPDLPSVAVPDDAEEAKKALREVLFRATERRLADGAVDGLLLSGGLDSSIIAAIAQEIRPGLHAFTVGAEGAPDVANAVEMAEHLGMEHSVRAFGHRDIERLIPAAVQALESFDEDCVSGAVANLFTSQWVSAHTNCILSGEGGDELNGGYHLLKDLPDEEARRQGMERLIEVAYNTALQRLDRAMMSGRMTYRTPFLDSEATAFCLQMPVSWKVHDTGGGHLVEKWLLREAFKDMLPESIYRREKLRFSRGTGVETVAEDVVGRLAAKEGLSGGWTTPAGYRISSPVEAYYYKLFKEQFPDPAFESLVGRWDPSK